MSKVYKASLLLNKYNWLTVFISGKVVGLKSYLCKFFGVTFRSIKLKLKTLVTFSNLLKTICPSFHVSPQIFKLINGFAHVNRSCQFM